jgi:LmbE family N-acetylglucosaminyl deacetylase
MRIMAFGPHPDDVEFQCAGTLAKYKAQGHEVAIAVMTRGDVGSPTLSRDEIAAIREKEARTSAAIIGAEFFWLGYDDEFLYDAPDVRRKVIDVIRRFRPDLVICPDKDRDYHPDHCRTGQIIWDTHVMTGIPLIPTAHPVCGKVHEIWYYDTLAAIGFEPEFYVDITEHWETKARMLDCHESQNAWMKHLFDVTLTENAQAQSRLRGFQTGCKYAEGFRRARAFPQSVPRDGLLPCGL